MKVVVDTNIFVMSLHSRSSFYDIFRKLKENGYELIVTNEILLEYEEVISNKYGNATATVFLSLLDELPNVHFIRTYFHWNLIESDPDDNKFVDAAIYADAIITTQDKHFNILKSIDFPPTTVIGIDDFFEMVKKM
jgi:uncharacterized protein